MSATAYRTHTCGDLRSSDIGKTVTLCGWVQISREKNCVFVDVRDRFGITQVAVDNPKNLSDQSNADALQKQKELFDVAKSLGRETVVRITGKVIERMAKNKDRVTGDVEVTVGADGGSIDILSQSKTPPLKIENETDASEETCMKYRFLDLRRPIMQERLMTRSKVTTAIRTELVSNGFAEIETPILIKSSPEGARDFVVPTRNHGQFYALPQSPQTFKQLLMVSGMDRYFQIARCFRDEELRADRQPEFTQIDCEMSFVSQEDILNLFENVIRRVFKEAKGIELPNPFPRLDYKVAMEKYGIDKPDLRYDMFLSDLTELAVKPDFPPFKDAGLVIALCVPGGSKRWSSGKALKTLEARARAEAGATCMVWVRCDCLDEKAGLKIESSADKHFSKEEILKWAQKANAQAGDVMCVFGGPGGRSADATREVVGKWRHIMGSELGLRPTDTFCPLWVVDFPLLEWGEEQGRWTAKHHPFTSSKAADKLKVSEAAASPGGIAAAIASGALDCEKLTADAYDLVINGVEVGGGSIRISERQAQEHSFELLGFTKEQAESQFGFLLQAFEYGTPPHGGLAFGLDRLCAIICGTATIRPVMAFPKNSTGRDIMIEAPDVIAPEQYGELGIKCDKPIAPNYTTAKPVAEEAAPSKKDKKKAEKAEKKDAPKGEKKDAPQAAAPKPAKKEKAEKAAAPEAAAPNAEEDRKKQLKKVLKEGGKRGVEIEGAADMGGLQFFCCSVDEPQGDLDMLVESLQAMNAKGIPGEEERRGCSGHVGKTIFSCGVEQLAVVAYVPEDKQAELNCEEWLKSTLALFKGTIVKSDGGICTGIVKADGNNNIFPLKIREPMILEANNFLRKKGLFPEDKDSDDEMVFGDDDFPS